MYAQEHQVQGINVLSQTDYLPILISSFLTDRKAQGFADETVRFYQNKLKYFSEFCEGQAVTQVSQLTPDLIRKVKAPKLPVEPIEPISLQDIHSLLETCKQSFSGSRDKGMMLSLLDTGARAQEFLSLNLEDVELSSGSARIRQGKGRKPRMVFLGRKTIRAIRRYLCYGKDNHPALWVSTHGERMTYSALRWTNVRSLCRNSVGDAFISCGEPHCNCRMAHCLC